MFDRQTDRTSVPNIGTFYVYVLLLHVVCFRILYKLAVWNYSKLLVTTVLIVHSFLNRSVGDQIIQFGDIAVSTSKNARMCNKCYWDRSSDGKVYVPYIFSSDFSEKNRIKIHSAMMEYSILTCIKFVHRTNEAAYIELISKSGCWSSVGRTGQKQGLSLQIPGCIHEGVIEHELMHALGLNHEQSRSDRDGYVRILLENIVPGNEHNFVKMKTNNMGTPYDYGSIMHYGKYSFSKGGGPTIEPKPDPRVNIGQRDGFSPLDVLKINKLNGCRKCNLFSVNCNNSHLIVIKVKYLSLNLKIKIR
uniref:Metalloendopeptidase n=1 Tax=Callorhinchus milii TaxID=7868 RepID=A0A4W3H4C0_CALMI